MKLIELQKKLFEDNPSRIELLDYRPTSEYKTYTVYVCRNHSFEFVEHTIGAYLDYAQLTVLFEYSDYDDSLSFNNINISADAILLWLDFSRYHLDKIDEFIKQRIRYLRSIYKRHILIAPFNAEDLNLSEFDIYTFDMGSIKNKFGKKYLDERLEVFSGTKLSNLALMEAAQMLALKYLPALFKQPIKAIIVDLDNTLYKGILGEDGINGLILSEQYIELQQLLFDLSKKGIFICIVSKNNIEDVKKLFEERCDFPLKWETFVKISASWDLKSTAIKEIVQFLNIHEESALFIDDNIGEIMEVLSILPEIKVIHALINAEKTRSILGNFPGIFRFKSGLEDELRKDDVKANEARAVLKQLMSSDEYIKSLNMILTYRINNKDDISRIVELSNKTNQFIFSYKRYTNSEITEYMDSESAAVISIYLKDRLSESGLIGACVFLNKGKVVFLEELFISCRALGRGIDCIMIMNAINIALDRLKIYQLKINFHKGDRNTPAEMFINKYLNSYLLDYNLFKYNESQSLLEVKVEK